MLLGVDASSTSYNIGQIAAVVVVVVIAAWVVRRALTTGFGSVRNRSRDGWIAALAVVVASVFLVKAASDGTFSSGNGDAWASQEGINIRAGFIDSCTHGRTDQAATCECAFNHIRALPALSTPDQFKAAAPLFQRAGADGNPNELPPGVVAAVRSCAPSAARS